MSKRGTYLTDDVIRMLKDKCWKDVEKAASDNERDIEYWLKEVLQDVVDDAENNDYLEKRN